MKKLKLADVLVTPRFVVFEDDEFAGGPSTLVQTDEQGQQAPFQTAISAKDWRANRDEVMQKIAEAIEDQIANAFPPDPKSNGHKRKPRAKVKR